MVECTGAENLPGCSNIEYGKYWSLDNAMADNKQVLVWVLTLLLACNGYLM